MSLCVNVECRKKERKKKVEKTEPIGTRVGGRTGGKVASSRSFYYNNTLSKIGIFFPPSENPYTRSLSRFVPRLSCTSVAAFFSGCSARSFGPIGLGHLLPRQCVRWP